jgi:hypothetical protein
MDNSAQSESATSTQHQKTYGGNRAFHNFGRLVGHVLVDRDDIANLHKPMTTLTSQIPI